MDIGLIGLPVSGKTTIFNALTGQSAVTAPSGKLEVNQAVVKVPDARVERLSALLEPKKTTHATVRYVDLAGLQVAEGAGLPQAALTHLGLTDMLLVVLRGFDAGTGAPDPAADAESVDLELTISDLQKIENRLPKLEKQIQRVAGAERDALQIEQDALSRAKGPLESGTALRELPFSHEELKAIRGFQFMSLKPVMYLVNCESVESSNSPEATAPLAARAARHATGVAALAGEIGQEIAQLAPDERAVFLAEYGIEHAGSERIIQRSYELLGLQSFLTAGKDEVRAWTIHKGSLAPEAAGVIHTDFQKGFIRAEVTSFDALSRLGTLKACREAGELRTEGKTYVVQDGDVIEFLFSR
ncbi:redox-regulated ATPase YchF [Candidatus Poribacteria bacterium]|nr:redox-regulated ATPase YchF [Candidatus Poribacteria bacterium]